MIEALLSGLPFELRELYRNDPVFHAVVTRAAILDWSQTEMLADAVKHLAQARIKAISAFEEHLRHCPPLIVVSRKQDG